MNYTLEPSKLFIEQFKELEDKTNKSLSKRLLLLEQNPFRNKKLTFHGMILFRIRFGDSHKEKRVIYSVDKNLIKLLFILDRKNDYKDLEIYLKKIGF